MRTAIYLIDTDVLVDALRDRPAAVAFLRGAVGDVSLSAITIAELWSGVRDPEEASLLDDFLSAFRVIPVSGEIARRAGTYRSRFGASHGTGLADCLVAATASDVGAELVTYNRRHFPMLDRILVPERD